MGYMVPSVYRLIAEFQKSEFAIWYIDNLLGNRIVWFTKGTNILTKDNGNELMQHLWCYGYYKEFITEIACLIMQCTSMYIINFTSDLCSPLTAPGNGMVDCSSEGTCVFTCNTGFTLSGSAVRRCQEDGTYTGTQPTCTQGTL